MARLVIGPPRRVRSVGSLRVSRVWLEWALERRCGNPMIRGCFISSQGFFGDFLNGDFSFVEIGYSIVALRMRRRMTMSELVHISEEPDVFWEHVV
jgi:hypothetical protein